MIRIVFGAVAAALVMLVIGLAFHATPLVGLGHGDVGDGPATEIQSSLSAHLPHTGTYLVPDPTASAAQNALYSQGGIATIHYNVQGSAALDAATILKALISSFIAALLIGLALRSVDAPATDFASRARLVVFFALGASAFAHVAGPIYWHHDWAHFFYVFIADALALIAGGLVIARWFLPHARTAPADAPVEV